MSECARTRTCIDLRLYLLIPAIAFLLFSNARAVELRPSDIDRSLQTALTLSREGKVAEAREMAQRALPSKDISAKKSLSRIADGSSIAGKIFYNTGDYLIAEEYFRDALLEAERLHGGISMAASLAMGDLAATYREERKYRDAEKLVTKSLALRRSLAPANSPYIAGNLDNLGRTFLATGRYHSAQDAFLEARNILMADYGFADDSVRREDGMLGLAQEQEAKFLRLLRLLLITPVLILGCALVSELPAVKRSRLLSQIAAVTSILILYGSKVLAILFGTFALMPLLMWALPSPLSQEQIRPISGLIGGASGLLAVVALTQFTYLFKKILESIFGWGARQV